MSRSDEIPHLSALAIGRTTGEPVLCSTRHHKIAALTRWLFYHM